MHRFTENYGKVLARALRYRKSVLLGTIFLFIGGMSLIPFIGTELFPRADAGNFVLEMRLASGIRIEETAKFSQLVESKLREWIEPADLKMIIINAGVAYGFPAAFTPNVGTQDVFFQVELSENRHHTSQYYAKIIREHLNKEFPKVELGIELGGLLTSALNQGLRAPIDIQIEGPNFKESYNIAQILSNKIKKIPGAVDVRVQQRFDAPLISIDIDRKNAMDLGVMTDEIVKNVVSAVAGSSTFDSNDIWVDPKTGIDYQMGVQFSAPQISSLAQLADIPIRGEDSRTYSAT